MKVIVRRDVGHEEPHNYAGRDVLAGEVLFVYEGFTYGCIDRQEGVALSMGGPFETPFFEFPRDAVDELTPGEVVRAGMRGPVLPGERQS